MLIRDDSFIHIQGWMVTRLGLEGLDLMIYACIHGFCLDDNSDFHGSRQYLADFCGASMSSIARSLKSLKDRGLIFQTYHSSDNSEVHYRVIVDPSDKLSLGVVSNCYEGSVKMTQGSCQNDTRVVSNCYEGNVKMTRAINDDTKEETKAETKDDTKVCCAQKRTRFQTPSLSEVSEYSRRNGESVVDPERFYNYYQANGWKVGKNPMKDWKAAFRMWENKDKKKDEAEKGFQRDQYGVKYMVNDHDLSDEQSSIDELDRLLAEE